MRAGTFDFPPGNGKAVHQLIDRLCGVMIRAGCQMGVFGGAQDGAVAEDFLYLEQVNARFNQMGGETMAIIPYIGLC